MLPSGERSALGEHVTTVGRMPESSLTLNDSNVSRRHAEIRPGRAGYLVQDLGSTNGTMVNGIKLTADQRLRDGDIISFGSTHVRFEAS